VGGGATSFLGLVALFRGLQYTGIGKLSQAAQQSMSQAAARAPGAALTFARNPGGTLSGALNQEWQQLASSPAGRAVGWVANRVRDEAVVRRGI